VWSGECIGDGVSVYAQELEISPQPLLVDSKGVQYVMQPYGREEEGTYLLKEVSLTYTEEELGAGINSGTESQHLPMEIYYRVTDALGQEIRNRYFVLASPPYPDRVETIGWIVPIRRADGI